MDRFGLDMGVEVAGGGGCSGAQRLWPPRPVCRRGRGRAGDLGEVGGLE
jgi:hypothetical protein